MKVLESVDFVICEELKQARRLLSYYNISKELVPLNEHNEKEATNDLIIRIAQGENAALISDAGTPLFSDPGNYFTRECVYAGIEISPVPGPSSLMAALVTTGLIFDTFYFFGWLSQKTDQRKSQLKTLRLRKEIIILMETPYRLKKLLGEISKVFGKNFHTVLAYKLTMPEEKIFRGPAAQILAAVEKDNLKGEFVLILDNRGRKNF